MGAVRSRHLAGGGQWRLASQTSWGEGQLRPFVVCYPVP